MDEPRRQSRWERTPPIARRALTSAGVGTITFLLTNLKAGKDNILWTITISLLIAAILFLAQYLVHLDGGFLRLNKAHEVRSEALKTTIDVRLVQLIDAAQLLSISASSPVNATQLRSLVEGLARIPVDDDLAIELVKAEFKRLHHIVKSISEGNHVECEGEESYWLLVISALELNRINAVSLVTIENGGQVVVDGGPWRSDRARRFFDLQATAAQRDANPTEIRRIFLVENAAVGDEPEFLELIAAQSSVGIQTAVLDLSTTLGKQHRTLPECVIFDAKAYYEPSPAQRTAPGERAVLINTRLELDRERVRIRNQQFERLWEKLHEKPQEA